MTDTRQEEAWREHREDCPGEDLCTLNSMRPSSAIARARGWGPGTVIEGDEGYGPERIEIRYVGQTVVARAVNGSGQENNWTLRARCWGRVGPVRLTPERARELMDEGHEARAEAKKRLDRMTEKWGPALSALADIEAAERRGYERGIREAVEAMGRMADANDAIGQAGQAITLRVTAAAIGALLDEGQQPWEEE